tara:strand:+ start:364 stop:2460 length:2097 start_codon:yes stop_codon:yes gene_type:complete
MTVFWADPFLEATTQGNGTTDTTTKDGTYAAPFSIADIISTTNASVAGINGYVISDGDEVRLKGLSFSDLFASEGNVYESSGADASAMKLNGSLAPVTGNSTADFTLAGSDANQSNIYAFKNSDISSFMNGWTHPLFFAARHDTVTAGLNHNLMPFTWAVVYAQLGHGSASDTGIEVFRLKDTYANRYSVNSYRYAFNFTSDVKISAGWTSETVQDGYSILEAMPTTGFERLYIGGGSSTTDTYFDLGRLVVHIGTDSSSKRYGRIYIDFIPSTDGGTGVLTAPMILASDHYENVYTDARPANTEVKFPLISGCGLTAVSVIQFSGGGADYEPLTFENLIGPSPLRALSFDAGYTTIKVGNLYARAEQGDDGFRRFTDSVTQAHNINCEFLSGSVYYIHDPDGESDISLSYSSVGNNTYGTNLKKPGIAPLNSSAFNTNASDHGPHFGSVVNNGANIFLSEPEISTTNDWFGNIFSRVGSRPIEYDSVGKLTSSADYRAASHNISYMTIDAASATGAPRYQIISGEHNTHDGIPISLLTDPYTSGIGFASLMYNDTVSSTDVLVGQWAGTTGGSSSQAWIPLELSVPSYTAASDSLRAKITVAYADGASDTAAGSVLLRAWHRDTTQSTNFRVYSSSATTVSAGGDPTSTTTVTLNLSNVATSGQDDITSVLLGIRLDFTDNTNIQKYYIASAEIEIY